MNQVTVPSAEEALDFAYIQLRIVKFCGRRAIKVLSCTYRNNGRRTTLDA